MSDPITDPVAAWNRLMEFAEDAEMEALEKLSPAELEAALAAEGLPSQRGKWTDRGEPVDPGAAWNRLLDFAVDAEMESLEKLSPAELEAALAAEGLPSQRGKWTDRGEPVDPGAAWNRLIDFAEDAEMERLEKLTPAELAAETREAEAEAAHVPEAEASRPALRAVPLGPVAASDGYEEEPRARVIPLRPRSRAATWAVRLIAAAIVVAIAAVGGVTIANRDRVPRNDDHGMTPDEVLARQLRIEAKDACDAKMWKPCLENLDEARRLDPAGESSVVVQAERAAAEKGVIQLQEERRKEEERVKEEERKKGDADGGHGRGDKGSGASGK